MNRIASMTAALLLTIASFGMTEPASAAKNAAPAKNPGCKATQWNLALPQGSRDESAVIVESADDHVWRVGVGRVPPQALLVIEYRSNNGIKGELVLQSGEAQFVEGSTVTMHLRRVSGETGRVAIAGTYQIKC